MAASTQPGEDHAWETVKENFQPLRKGRKASALRKGLSSMVPATLPEHEAKRKEFEDKLAAASDSDDILGLWRRYISWIEDTFPAGGKAAGLREVLHRCTQALVDDERYQNDPDYVHVWIKYANTLPDPADVFRFMRERRIGEKVALFWMAFALVAEKSKRYDLAAKCFRAAIAKGATPTDRLKKRQLHFYRRMATKAKAVLGAPASQRGDRVDLVELARVEAGQELAEQASTLPPGAQAQASSSSRTALGGISAAAAARSHRSGGVGGAHQPSQARGFGAAASSSAARNAKIEVFVDEVGGERGSAVAAARGSAAEAVAALEPQAMAGGWRPLADDEEGAPRRVHALASNEELHKENATSASSCWVGDGGLPVAAGTEDRLAATVGSSRAQQVAMRRHGSRTTRAVRAGFSREEALGRADEAVGGGFHVFEDAVEVPEPTPAAAEPSASTASRVVDPSSQDNAVKGLQERAKGKLASDERLLKHPTAAIDGKHKPRLPPPPPPSPSTSQSMPPKPQQHPTWKQIQGNERGMGYVAPSINASGCEAGVAGLLWGGRAEPAEEVTFEEARALAWAQNQGSERVQSILEATESAKMPVAADEGQACGGTDGDDDDDDDDDDDEDNASSSMMECSPVQEKPTQQQQSLAASVRAQTPTASRAAGSKASQRTGARPNTHRTGGRRCPGTGGGMGAGSSVPRPRRVAREDSRRATLGAMTPSMLGKMFGNLDADEDDHDDAEEASTKGDEATTAPGTKASANHHTVHPGQDDGTADAGAMARMLRSSSVGRPSIGISGGGTADLSALIGALGRPIDEAPSDEEGSPGEGERNRRNRSGSSTGPAAAGSSPSAHDGGSDTSRFDGTHGQSSFADDTSVSRHSDASERDDEEDEAVARLAAQASVVADSVGSDGHGRDVATPTAASAASRAGVVAAGRAQPEFVLDALTPATDAKPRRAGPHTRVATDEDITINTKLAVADLDAMLSSPSAPFGDGQLRPFLAPSLPSSSAKQAGRLPAPTVTGTTFTPFEENRHDAHGGQQHQRLHAAVGVGGHTGSNRRRPVVWQAGSSHNGRRAALGSLVKPSSPALSPITSRGPLQSKASPAPVPAPVPAAVAALDVSISTTRGAGATAVHGRSAAKRLQALQDTPEATIASPPLAVDGREPAPAAARTALRSSTLGGLQAPSFAVFDDAGEDDNDEEECTEHPVDENAGMVSEGTASGTEAPTRIAVTHEQSVVRDRALRSLPVPEAPERRLPGAPAFLDAAASGSSVDIGDAFVVFDEGLGGDDVRQAAEAAMRVVA